MDEENKTEPEHKADFPIPEKTEVTSEPVEEPEPVVRTSNFEKKGLKSKLFGSKKRIAMSAAVLLVVIGVGGYFYIKSSSPSTEVANNSEEVTQITATVSYIEGTVERKDGETYALLKVNDILKEGDVVRTAGATSRATLALSNGSFARLNGDTEIVLTAMRSNEVVIMQNNGQVYSRVSPTANAAYTVETNVGTYAAQGTAFMTTSGGDEESVEVYESQVKENTSDKTVNQGEKLYIKNVQDTEKEGDVVPLDIEEVKKDEFVSWCRSEDEKLEAFKDKLGFLSDVKAPALSISSPANSTVISVDSSATKGSVAFKGKTDAGATVTIQAKSVSGSKPVEVEVGEDGSFESDEIDGIVGANTFEVVAMDEAGNKAKKSITVTFKKPTSTNTTGISLSKVGND